MSKLFSNRLDFALLLTGCWFLLTSCLSHSGEGKGAHFHRAVLVLAPRALGPFPGQQHRTVRSAASSHVSWQFAHLWFGSLCSLVLPTPLGAAGTHSTSRSGKRQGCSSLGCQVERQPQPGHPSITIPLPSQAVHPSFAIPLPSRPGSPAGALGRAGLAASILPRRPAPGLCSSSSPRSAPNERIPAHPGSPKPSKYPITVVMEIRKCVCLSFLSAGLRVPSGLYIRKPLAALMREQLSLGGWDSRWAAATFPRQAGAEG